MESLTLYELEFLLGRVYDYLDRELDLNQREWGFTQGIKEKLIAEIEVREDA